MKTKLAKRFSQFIAVLAFLTVLAGNAFAFDNTNRVVSPYWQSDSGSYTFVAVTHTSLSGMASQIGLTINAINNDQSLFSGSALTFTVTQGTPTYPPAPAKEHHAARNRSQCEYQGGYDAKLHCYFHFQPLSCSPFGCDTSLACYGGRRLRKKHLPRGRPPGSVLTFLHG